VKRLLTILLLCCNTCVVAQDDPAQLAADLTRGLSTERQKVDAIFHWITDNISYKVRRKYPTIVQPTVLPADDTGALKSVNERVAISVLRSREGLCEGYARLFVTLCDYAGIESSLVAGYCRGGSTKPHPRFGVNHYWNAVKINGDWYLLDATWAAGYVTRGGEEFVREFDPRYYLAPPEQFIADHYPDDIRWTLLPDTRVPVEFRRSPFLQKSFSKYAINWFYPRFGVIEAKLGDTIRLSLTTADPERDKAISPDMLVDSTLFSASEKWVFLHPDPGTGASLARNTKTYTLPVNKEGIEWLYLMYNEDMVLRYKVKIIGDRP